MQFLLKLLTRLPLPLLYGFGRALFVIAYYGLRWRVRLAANNLRNAFPEKTEAERAAILKASYRNLGDLVAEVLHGYGATAEDMRRRVRFENPEALARPAERGQSVVLLAAHFCNWEWLLLSGSVQFEVPIDAVYKPQRVGFIDRFLRDGRSRFGGTPIPHKRFLFRILRGKDRARAYALVADQTPIAGEDKHWTRFLNQDTAFHVGAGQIARVLGASVLFVAMRRLARGCYSVRLIVLAEPPYPANADRDVGAGIIDRYARALEDEIRASPADWLWIHRKWKYAKPLHD